MKKPHKPFINKQGEVRPLRASDEIILSPLSKTFPELAAWSEKRKRGRPKTAAPKQLQSFKLSPDVIHAIKSSGAGYNTRVEQALRDALSDGRI